MAGNEKFEVQPPAEQLFLQHYRAAGKKEPCEKTAGFRDSYPTTEKEVVSSYRLQKLPLSDVF